MKTHETRSERSLSRAEKREQEEKWKKEEAERKAAQLKADKFIRRLTKQDQKEVCQGQRRGSKRKNGRKRKQSERQHSWRLTGAPMRKQNG